MKNIHYAGDVLMTGDAIADAVVQYAETLAQHETSASINVPVITESGDAMTASFLLGPASQLVAVAVETQFPDPVDPDLLEEIDRRRRILTGVQVEPSDDDAHHPPFHDEY
jgi:hypothetical protein